MSTRRETPVAAGITYFAVVFALGFVFGVARTLVMQANPGIDRTVAVLFELPLILAAAWFAAGRLSRDVRTHAGRVRMGVVALALLLAAEAALGVFLFGRTIAEHLALYRQPSHALGLAGQVLFAAFPWLRLSFRR
jgi:hypothetical protein